MADLKTDLEPYLRPEDNRPFEAWEEMQTALLSHNLSAYAKEETDFLIGNPMYFRAFRRALKERMR